MAKDIPEATYLKDYRPPAYLVEQVELHFDLQPRDTIVAAELLMRRNADHGDDQMALSLDGEDMELVSLSVDGTELSSSEFFVDQGGLSIAAVPELFRLNIVTKIAPADNTNLEGLYQSDGIFCTQCEAEGFRRITYFPDRPDVMTTYRVTIQAAKAACPILLSNGNLVDSGDLDHGRHYAVWDDPFPKPSYLFGLVAGDLHWLEDGFVTQSGRQVALRIYTNPGNEGRCVYAMDALKRSMRWDEEKYGLEYDLDLFNAVSYTHLTLPTNREV